MEIEEKEQLDFIEGMKDQFYEDHLYEIEAGEHLTKALSNKVSELLKAGFKSIKNDYSSKNSPVVQNPRIKKALLLGFVTLLNSKVQDELSWGFRNVIEHYGPAQTREAIESNNKFRGKMLMGLKEYPKMGLKSAFWKWFIRTTGSGE